jgi:signal transduction histidine kinase
VLRHREDQLEIVVTNGVAADGHEVAEGGRHGLIGMRERAALLGGRLDAGGENGTFCVHATLPYGDTST